MPQKNLIAKSNFILRTLILSAVIFPTAVWAQGSQEVLSSEVDLDQGVVEEGAPASNLDVVYEEQQILRVNQSLKNAIEENKQLLQEKDAIGRELKQMRGQREVEANRTNAQNQERDDLLKRVEELNATNESQAKKLNELEQSLNQKTQEWQTKVQRLEEQLSLEEKWHEEIQALTPQTTSSDASVENPAIISDDPEINNVLGQVDQLNRENEQLKKDSAKIHYNLGNLAFQQGDYARAVLEYRQAVDLMPFDAPSHYNLAYVSGEYLDDQKTALKHYQQYLYLNPQADDAKFVKELILKARLELKSTINSPLDAKSKIPDAISPH